MHSINEIDCYFSSFKVIFDIDFFGASLVFIFICISTWFLSNIRLFNKTVIKTSVKFTSAIFSSEYDIKPTIDEDSVS